MREENVNSFMVVHQAAYIHFPQAPNWVRVPLAPRLETKPSSDLPHLKNIFLTRINECEFMTPILVTS